MDDAHLVVAFAADMVRR